MVADLIRVSPFGQVVRLVSRQRYLQYPEEQDHNLWKKYVNEEKSGYMAHHGSAQPPEEESQELNQAQGLRAREGNDSETSSRTQVGEGINEASGVRDDSEKGKDKHVIGWYGPDDPQVSVLLPRSLNTKSNTCTQNPRNWSRAKKFFVFRNMLPHILCLHRISHLHTWSYGRRPSLRRRTSSSYPWPDVIRRWLWSWTHHLVAHERDSPGWSALGVYRNIV